MSPRASATQEEHSSVLRVQLSAACKTGPNPAQEAGSKTNQQPLCWPEEPEQPWSGQKAKGDVMHGDRLFIGMHRGDDGGGRG